MGKHARKRQRTAKVPTGDVVPLGAALNVADDAGKDDEERRLESMLFGKPYIPSDEGKDRVITVADDEEDEDVDEDVDPELEGMLDTDLFFVDDAAPSNQKDVPEPDIQLALPEDSDESGSASGSGDDSVDEQGDEPPSPPPEEPVATSSKLLSKTRKAPAWVDPDDTSLQVNLAASTRLRKLRDAPDEATVGGREYERRLRRQFEKINPTPEWATTARKKRAKRRREPGSGEESAGDVEDVDGLVSVIGGVLGKSRRRALEPGMLSIERLRDANQAAQAEGEVKVVQFHPSPQVPVLLTASADRRIRLFNIDGHTNPHLQTLHIPSLPVTAASFHPSGSSILLTGQRPFYYTYDLQSGATTRSPRGLWGTTFNSSNPGSEDLSMEVTAFDPSGEVLAVAGRRGYVHLVDWKSGAGQVVGSVKGNAAVKALWWARTPGGTGRELLALGEDAEVYVWDVGARRCVRRWKDDGGFGARVLSGDRAGNYIAVGSKSGIVNVYGSDAVSSSGSERPKPLKAIGNLTTSISAARFNHDSQLLAIASNVKKDQMRLIHLPSLTAFSNWPTSSTPLGHVSSVDFSAGSEYVAVGNSRGRVLLYHLRDFDKS
ncbi:WD40 repeat-like protein [Auriscalpium vulgare]|uniref:WD40 repeat-like protein n=1 Tax=Auriscalpium vulgare TaxID=40419 RepID=A0ACB8RP15_9AGAM|nr:WD40 repeat-like protein [Auriscalpium vulgare]